MDPARPERVFVEICAGGVNLRSAKAHTNAPPHARGCRVPWVGVRVRAGVSVNAGKSSKKSTTDHVQSYRSPSPGIASA